MNSLILKDFIFQGNGILSYFMEHALIGAKVNKTMGYLR